MGFADDFIHSQQWEVDLIMNIIGWTLSIASGLYTGRTMYRKAKATGRVKGSIQSGDILGMTMAALGIALASMAWFVGWDTGEGLGLSIAGFVLAIFGAVAAHVSASEPKTDKLAKAITFGGVTYGAISIGYSVFRFTLWH